ncbi:hypothetical protein QEN19_000605 [Hanseniaspora menglaensis]
MNPEALNTNSQNNISLLTKQQQHYIFMQQQQQLNRRRSSVFNNATSGAYGRNQSIVVPPTRIAGPNLQNQGKSTFLHQPSFSPNEVQLQQNDYLSHMHYNNSQQNMRDYLDGNNNINTGFAADRKFSLQHIPNTAPHVSFSPSDNPFGQQEQLSIQQFHHLQQQNSTMAPPSLKPPATSFQNQTRNFVNNYRRSSIQPFMQMNHHQSFKNINFEPPLNSSAINTGNKSESHLSPIDVSMFVKDDDKDSDIQWNFKYEATDLRSKSDEDLLDPIHSTQNKQFRNINLKLKKFKRFEDFSFDNLNSFQNPSSTIDPLISKTSLVTSTFKNNNSSFAYETQTCNPRRLLTKPSVPNIDANPYNCDNEVGYHIIHVGDVIGLYNPQAENLTSYKSTPSITSRNGFKIMDVLGKGTFGQVVKCKNLTDESIVAIKMIKASKECMIPSFMECKVLQTLQNQKMLPINNKDDSDKYPFINFLEEFIYKGHLCIVFELLGPSIVDVLQTNKFHGLNWDLIGSFSKQLFQSLEKLKIARIIHCDLKPENILLKTTKASESTLKVIDFGASCFENQTVYTYIQSRFYRAPEVVLGLPYNSGIDMWSVGCVIAELYLGIPLFPGQSEYDLMARIIGSGIISDGIPPKWMLDRSRFSTLFFHYDPHQMKYTRLKTIEEYNIDLTDWTASNNEIIIHHLGYPRKTETPGKQYFKNSDNFCKLILLHRIHKLTHLTDSKRLEIIKKRWIFYKFLQKCLHIDPFQRYTPTEALRDSFITGKWEKNYNFDVDQEFKTFLAVEQDNIFGKLVSNTSLEGKKQTPPKSGTTEDCHQMEKLQL